MNLSGNSTDGAALRVRKVFASQRAAFEADPYPLAERRREKIKALKRQISRYQAVLWAISGHCQTRDTANILAA